MEESFYSEVNFGEQDEEEEESDLYDIPRPHGSYPSFQSSMSHSEADYTNFKEMSEILIPMLPPKKRVSSQDLDKEMGITTTTTVMKDASALPPGAGPGILIAAPIGEIKHPVAAPRQKSLEGKHPVPVPRMKSRKSIDTAFVRLSDATVSESTDFDQDFTFSKADNAHNNNNVCDRSCTDVKTSQAYDVPLRDDLSTATAGAKLCTLLGARLTTDSGVSLSDECLPNYINVTPQTSDVEKPSNDEHIIDVQNMNILRQQQGVVSPDAFGKGCPNYVNMVQQQNLLGSAALEDVRFSGSTDHDYMNVPATDLGLETDEEKEDYVNMNNCLTNDSSAINLNNLLSECLPSVRNPQRNLFPTTWGHPSLTDPPTLIPRVSTIPKSDQGINRDSRLSRVSLDRNSTASFGSGSIDSEFLTSSPPKFTPPPLPSGLLIDFTDDDLYKVPVVHSLAPMIPRRPSSPPPPPVPDRRTNQTKLELQTTVSGAFKENHSKEPANRNEHSRKADGSEEEQMVSATDADRNLSSASSPLSRTNSALPPTPKSGRGQSVLYFDASNAYEITYEMNFDPSVLQTSYDQLNSSNQTASISSNQTTAPDESEIADYKGYLVMVVGNTPKTVLEKKWCTLDPGSLSIYPSNNQSSPVQDVIQKREMLSIASAKDDRPGSWFELTSRPPTKVWLFSTETTPERISWMTRIAKNMALVNSDDLDQISDIERGGNVFIRNGAESEWMHTWIHLSNKTLFIYNKDEEFEEVDLRKSKGLRQLQMSDRCTQAFEHSLPLAIDLPSGRVIYIQSDVKKDQERWVYSLQNSILLVGDSLESQALTADNVPLVVEKCINFVAAYGLELEGIYRLNGQNSKVTKLLELFRSDPRGMVIKLGEYSVHDAANALKRFFRELDVALLTRTFHKSWIEASDVKSLDAKLQMYKHLLGCLHLINFCTLKRLIIHLARVVEVEDKNKMVSANVASIFGPVLMTVNKDTGTGFGTTNQEIKIVKDFIDNYRWLFDIKEEEVDQENKFAAAVKKIEQLNLARNHAIKDTMMEDGVLLGVYINSKDGDVVTLKVPSTMTAEELQTYVSEKAQIVLSPYWNLFEVICNGCLERPIHQSENIFHVTLKWTDWPLEFCQNNFLCLKFNSLYEGLQLLYEPHQSLFSELKYASRKGFHKYFFQYNQCNLSYRKDARAEYPAVTWKVEDLILFVGIQHIRRPPTKWGFTFYSINEKLNSPYFGHSICCNSEEEMYRWLAPIFQSQRQGSFLKSRSSIDISKPSNHENQSQTMVAQSTESSTSTTSSYITKWKFPFKKR